MAAYHSIAVTLGQAGMVRELNKLIENMRQKPSRNIKSMRRKNWDPTLEPDVVIYNAVGFTLHTSLILFSLYMSSYWEN